MRKIHKSIGQRGLSHLLVPLLFIFLIAVVGVTVLIDSHAQTPNPSVPAPITVTNTDSGKTVSLSVGQELIVKLSNVNWAFASPSNAAVLSQLSKSTLNPAGQSSVGYEVVTYKAEEPGTSNVSATLIVRPVCKPGLLCPADIAVSRFILYVKVGGTNQQGTVKGTFFQAENTSWPKTQTVAYIGVNVANNAKVSKVEWLLNNSLQYTQTNPVVRGLFQYNWPIANLKAGTYRWTAEVFDSNNNIQLVKNNKGNPYLDMKVN